MIRHALPLTGLALLVLLFTAGLQQDPRRIPSPLIGRPAPALPQRLPDAVPESAPAGGARLVNFWASWCAPCLQEHPLLSRAARRGVPIVGVNYKDDPRDATAWLERNGNPFHDIRQDRDGAAGLEWGVYGVPETFVVDAAGVIRHKHVGPLTPEVWDRDFAPLFGNGK